MLPFSFESENRTVREILSMGGRELLLEQLEGKPLSRKITQILVVPRCGR
jgi:hypothetical protein